MLATCRNPDLCAVQLERNAFPAFNTQFIRAASCLLLANVPFRPFRHTSQEYLRSARVDGSRPSTALQATLYSHTARMRAIESRGLHGAAFQRTSSAYGSRSSLEQFGVSQHGVRESRTKLPPA